MRYFVRNERGEELVCPSLADLHALYRQGFFSDADEVRSERSGRWQRVGDFEALSGERGRLGERGKALLLLAVAALAALAFWLFAHARR